MLAPDISVDNFLTRKCEKWPFFGPASVWISIHFGLWMSCILFFTRDQIIVKKTEIWKEKARKPFEFYMEEEGSDNAVLQKEQVGGYKQNSPNWICRHFLQNYQVCFLFLDSPKALNFNEVTPMAKCKIIMKERWILVLWGFYLFFKLFLPFLLVDI